jgi:hypothetical protein
LESSVDHPGARYEPKFDLDIVRRISIDEKNDTPRC